MFCPSCGSPLADGARFCPRCGNPVSGPVAPATPPVPGASAGAAASSCPAYGPAVKTDRSLLAYIVLSIVTCGIYGFWFVYSIAADTNRMCQDDGEKTGGLVAYILLSFVTCGLYNLYWMYKLANRLAANASRYGMSFQENGTTVLMWYLVGLLLCGLGPLVATHIIIKNTNALAAAYNARLAR